MIDRSYEEIIYHTKKMLLGSMYGLNSTKIFGDGGEFAEIGEYMGGDIRHLNYKATSKSATTKINLYYDNRNIDIILLYIANSSMLGGDIRTKHSLAIEVMTALSYSAYRLGDRVLALIYSDKDSRYIKGYNGRDLSNIIYEIGSNIDLRYNEASISKAFDEVALLNRKKSLIFVVSDFLEVAEIEKISYKDEVVLISIREEAEEDMSLLNGNILIDPSNRYTLWADIDKSVAKEYKSKLNKINKFWIDISHNLNITLIKLYTNSNPYPPLKLALAKRDKLI